MGVKQNVAMPPLFRLLEEYRVACDIPTQTLAAAIGVTRLAYYSWLSNKASPVPRNLARCKLAGAAMKRAYENQDLPVPKTRTLTRKQREATIRDVLFRYVDALSAKAD